MKTRLLDLFTSGEFLPAVRLGQHLVEMIKGDIGPGHDRVQKNFKVVQEPGDVGLVEEIGAVLQSGQQPLARINHVQNQIELNRCPAYLQELYG